MMHFIIIRCTLYKYNNYTTSTLFFISFYSTWTHQASRVYTLHAVYNILINILYYALIINHIMHVPMFDIILLLI